MQNRDGFINAFYELQNYDLKVIEPLIDSIDAYLATNGPDTKLEFLSCALKTQREIVLNNDFIKACEIAKSAVDILQNTDWDLFELDIFIILLDRIESYELATAMMKKAHDMLDSKFRNLEFYDYTKFKIFAASSERHLRAKYYDNADPKKIKEMFDACINSAIKICEKYKYLTFRTVLIAWRAIFEEDVKKIFDCISAIEDTKDDYWITVVKNKVVEYTRHLGDNVTTKLKNFVTGWQIKKRRKELSMSTIELADMIDSSQTTINQIERGIGGVSQKRLYKIAKALAVEDLLYFMGGPIRRATTIVAMDVHTHHMVQMMSPLSDKDKGHAVELLKVFIKSINDGK